NGIVGIQNAFGCSVAQRRGQVFHGPFGKLVSFFADLFVLRAQLGTNRSKRTPAELPELLVFFYLILDDPIAVLPETLERRHLRGKNLVHQAALLIPMIFKSCCSKIGLRLE